MVSILGNERLVRSGIVFLGVKVVLPLFKAAETIPVCPGKILTFFFATIGMEICCISSLFVV